MHCADIKAVSSLPVARDLRAPVAIAAELLLSQYLGHVMVWVQFASSTLFFFRTRESLGSAFDPSVVAHPLTFLLAS